MRKREREREINPFVDRENSPTGPTIRRLTKCPPPCYSLPITMAPSSRINQFRMQLERLIIPFCFLSRPLMTNGRQEDGLLPSSLQHARPISFRLRDLDEINLEHRINSFVDVLLTLFKISMLLLDIETIRSTKRIVSFLLCIRLCLRSRSDYKIS